MIVIIGASKGIGRAIAEDLLLKGIEILGVSRKILNNKFKTFQCNVSREEEVRELVNYLKKNNKEIDGIINCAGIASMNLALAMPLGTSRDIIETNLLGTIFISQLLTPLMIKNKKGFIINFSTIAVPLGVKGEAAYAASKAGVEVFSRIFAKEVSPYGVRVNCIAPGPIATDLIQGVPERDLEKIIGAQVINQKFSTQDICNIVNFLRTEEASSISGQIIRIGGV